MPSNHSDNIHVYPLAFEARHMVVTLPEGRFILDTGSPQTFGRPKAITFGSERHALGAPIVTLDFDSLVARLGLQVDGILGLDVLAEHDTLWDGPAGRLCIGASPVDSSATAIPAQVGLGLMVNGTINGIPAQCVFDTGAHVGYVFSERFVAGAPRLGAIYDFNPIIGDIDNSESWRVPVEWHGIRFEEQVGILTGAIAVACNMAGIEAIVGCSWLPTRRVWFRPAEGELFVL